MERMGLYHSNSESPVDQELSRRFVPTRFTSESVMHGDCHIDFNDYVQLHPDVQSGSLFAKLLTIDVTGLCTHLTAFVIDSSKRKEIVELRGPAAQALLNLLQAVRSLHKLRRMPLMQMMTVLGLCYRFSAPASICGRAFETVASLQALSRELCSEGD